ncbi:MAG: nucleotidyltransferase family protein [Candidatus Binatia bacterium]
MVLAAGQGIRLRPTTDNTPKALVPVAGRPMIEYALLLLRHYDIKDVIINLHHFGEQIENRLGDGRALGLKINYSREPELLDTGGGLLKAKSFLQDGAFMVINTDALIDLNLAALIDFHVKKAAAVTLVLRPDIRADEYGSMDVDSSGRICRFLDSKAPITPVSAPIKLMFTGVQIIDPKVFDYMENHAARRKFSTTKHIYPRMLVGGERLFAFQFEGFWQDLGTPERIREAEMKMKNGQARLHYL